jgi:hypothetical protein
MPSSSFSSSSSALSAQAQTGVLLFALSALTLLAAASFSSGHEKRGSKSGGRGDGKASTSTSASSSANGAGATAAVSSQPPKVALPVIDFDLFNGRSGSPQAYRNECLKAAEAFHKYGCCIVRDPRVNEAHNERFLDMLEQYFEMSDGVRDARPEVAYQVGVTPEFIGKFSGSCPLTGVNKSMVV